MGILFYFTLLTVFLLFIAFLKNYQSVDTPIPHWYIIVHSVEILLYLFYFATRKYIRFKRSCSLLLLFILHDIFLVSIMLLISSMEKFLYISLTLFYYTFFFSVIVVKKTREGEEDPIHRSELPRKTFFEMTELNHT